MASRRRTLVLMLLLFLALAVLVWLANPPRAAAKMAAATGSHE